MGLDVSLEHFEGLSLDSWKLLREAWNAHAITLSPYPGSTEEANMYHIDQLIETRIEFLELYGTDKSR